MTFDRSKSVTLMSFLGLFALVTMNSNVHAEPCSPVQPCLPGLIEEGDALNGVSVDENAAELVVEEAAGNETEVNETEPPADPSQAETEEQSSTGELAEKYKKCREARKDKNLICKEIPENTYLTNEQVAALKQGQGTLAAANTMSALTQIGRSQSGMTAETCYRAGDLCQEICDDEAVEIGNDPTIAPPMKQTMIQAWKDSGKKCFEEAYAVVIDNVKQYNAYDDYNNASNASAAAASGAGDVAGHDGGGASAGSAGGDPAPASSGGGGAGGGNMMQGMLLGAAAGMGAMCLMGTLCEGEKDDEDKKAADTPVNCQNDEDAYQKSECKEYFLLQCTGYLSAPGCDDFSPYYCGLTEDEGASETSVASTYQEGAGTDYCQIVIASQYCERKGREACPSCQNLARMSSDACKDNPSVCLPQMSTEDKKMAQNICPTDPMFSHPQFISDTDDNTESIPEGTGPVSTTGGYASSARGPASEVGRSIGPSVFSQTSQLIEKRCREGKLNNCGIRSFTTDEAYTH